MESPSDLVHRLMLIAATISIVLGAWLGGGPRNPPSAPGQLSFSFMEMVEDRVLGGTKPKLTKLYPYAIWTLKE